MKHTLFKKLFEKPIQRGKLSGDTNLMQFAQGATMASRVDMCTSGTVSDSEFQVQILHQKVYNELTVC